MKLIFLGTSAGAPTKTRNVSGLCLQWVQQGKLWLFDCGEGTQHQFHRAPVSLAKLDKIFVTHLHGDHVFGLPGLMASRSAAQSSEVPLTLFGPSDLKEYLTTSLLLTSTRIKYPWEVNVISEGEIYADDHCTVVCSKLNHGIPSHGYAILEKDQPGEFQPNLAIEAGIEPGPDFGILKSGRDIQRKDGTIIHGADMVGPLRKGRKVVVCGDTGVTPATVALAKDADVLVHEATFMADQLERAVQVGHSTTQQAAQAAADAGVRLLVLTHFSPRYEQENSDMMGALLAEAQEIFPNTVLAEDFLTIDIPHLRL